MLYTNVNDYLEALIDYQEQRDRTPLEDEQILTDPDRVGVSDE